MSTYNNTSSNQKKKFNLPRHKCNSKNPIIKKYTNPEDEKLTYLEMSMLKEQVNILSKYGWKYLKAIKDTWSDFLVDWTVGDRTDQNWNDTVAEFTAEALTAWKFKQVKIKHNILRL